MNLALLAVDQPLDSSHGLQLPDPAHFGNVSSAAWGSVIPSEHMRYAAFRLLEENNDRDAHLCIKSSHFALLPRARHRRKIYVDFVNGARYWQKRDGPSPSFPAGLRYKIRNLTGSFPSPTEISNLKANSKLLAPFVSPSLWNHQVKMTFNALTTDVRLTSACIKVVERAPPTQVSLLYLW
jgi:hypothetical protein